MVHVIQTNMIIFTELNMYQLFNQYVIKEYCCLLKLNYDWLNNGVYLHIYICKQIKNGNSST